MPSAKVPPPRRLSSLITALSVTLLLASNSVAQQTEPTPDCDYSGAPDNFGWGWDPVTETSCAPTDQDQVINLFLPQPDSDTPDTDTPSREALIDELRADYCDYADAPLHGGWGWNNVLGESCPPIVANYNAPVVVSDIVLPFIDYPLHLHVSSVSTLYLFHPAKHTLAARQLDGSVIWETALENSTFITDMRLTPDQNLLIASSLGGRLIAFHTDGSVAWQIDEPGVSNSGPAIQVGDTAVVAYYVPEENAGIDPFIVSYDFDGAVRWRFEGEAAQAQDVQEFTLGPDGLVYILIDEREQDRKRYVVVQQ